MIALFNPRRRRRGHRKAHGRRRRRVSMKTRARLRRLALGRSRRGAYRKGLLEGGKKCARAFKAIKSRVPGGGLPAHLRSIIPGRVLGNRRVRRNQMFYKPRYLFNPGGLVGGVTGGVKHAFSPSIIKESLPLLGGMVAGGWLTGAIGNLPVTPSFLQSGYGRVVLKGASAGVASMLVGMIAPQYSQGVLLGGVLSAVLSAADQLGLKTPGFSGLGCACNPLMAGMGDFLNTSAVGAAKPAPTYAPIINSLGGIGNDDPDGDAQGCHIGSPFQHEDGAL